MKEAALYLGLKEPTLYEWVRQKKIPHVKLGKALRFDIEQLDKFINE